MKIGKPCKTLKKTPKNASEKAVGVKLNTKEISEFSVEQLDITGTAKKTF